MMFCDVTTRGHEAIIVNQWKERARKEVSSVCCEKGDREGCEGKQGSTTARVICRDHARNPQPPVLTQDYTNPGLYCAIPYNPFTPLLQHPSVIHHVVNYLRFSPSINFIYVSRNENSGTNRPSISFPCPFLVPFAEIRVHVRNFK